MQYPYARPLVRDEDVEAVVAAIRSQFLTQGPNLEALEAELSAAFGVKHVVVCNSGTAALHLAYASLGVGPNDGVITSAVTFLATANAARMCGAPVAFADVDPVTGNVTAETMAAAAEQVEFDVRVLAPVHLGGRPADMIGMRELADRLGCALVEDACHAPGAVYRDPNGNRHQVGACAHSDAATFSFHAIKHVTMGEGGAVFTNDDQLAARARLMRSHGIDRRPEAWRAPPEAQARWYYEMDAIGWNYRASELACALGRSQLPRLSESNAARRHLATRYDTELSGLPTVALPPVPVRADEHAWHLYAPRFDFEGIGRTRGQVMQALADRGIGTQVHYIPLYRQPYYADAGHPFLPGAEAYYARTLSLPLYFGLGDDDIEAIAAAVRAEIGCAG